MTDIVYETLLELRRNLIAQTKLDFIDDVEAQLEDESDIKSILLHPTRSPRQLVVTFDRRKNDSKFMYSYADMILAWLDSLSGGVGIKKPLSQLRVITWARSRGDLLKVLRFLRRHNSQINFRRILILPYPNITVGYKLDPSIYMK